MISETAVTDKSINYVATEVAEDTALLCARPLFAVDDFDYVTQEPSVFVRFDSFA